MLPLHALATAGLGVCASIFGFSFRKIAIEQGNMPAGWVIFYFFLMTILGMYLMVPVKIGKQYLAMLVPLDFGMFALAAIYNSGTNIEKLIMCVVGLIMLALLTWVGHKIDIVFDSTPAD